MFDHRKYGVIYLAIVLGKATCGQHETTHSFHSRVRTSSCCTASASMCLQTRSCWVDGTLSLSAAIYLKGGEPFDHSITQNCQSHCVFPIANIREYHDMFNDPSQPQVQHNIPMPHRSCACNRTRASAIHAMLILKASCLSNPHITLPTARMGW